MSGGEKDIFTMQDDVTFTLFTDYAGQSVTSQELKESFSAAEAQKKESKTEESVSVKTDEKSHLHQLLCCFDRSGERVYTATQLVIGIHFVEYLDKILTTCSFMEEEGEIHSADDFKLFAEILVLTLESEDWKKR